MRIISLLMFFPMLVGVGGEFRLDTGFPKLPAGLKLDAVSAVEIAADGNVVLFHRGRQPILVFTPAGKFVRSFGKGLFDSTHGLRRDAEGNLWTTDNRNHTVRKFSPAGKLLLTLGERGKAGADKRLFNRPADVAFGRNGDVFIADGYGNSRVVKLDRSGKFIRAWGRKGQGPGEFNLPHAIRVGDDGLVYVGDRENDRVQVFDQDGKYVREFGGFAPFGLEFGPEGNLFVADGRANKVIKMNRQGKVLAEWGTLGSEPGNFNMPHGITVASDGTVYVSEIRGKRVQKFVPQHSVAPIRLDVAKTPNGEDWIRLADPAGILNVENGITDAEAANFDRHGKLLVTCSKADGRHPSTKHGKSAHVSVWNVATGELVWDRKRSRGPDKNGDGFPDNQPRNREDEVEIAIWSPDGRFVAAGGEDDQIEIWRVRVDNHDGDEWLSEPELVKTFSTGDGNKNTDDAGIDSMGWSHDGRLLFAGTEQGGRIEVFVTQGSPKDWKLMHKARHGGQRGFAVNSLDLTEDDRYLGTAGTDTKSTFWRVEVTENKAGKITAVRLVKLATLLSKNGKPIDGSGREARFEPNGDRHFIYTLERTGLVQVYKLADLIAWKGPNTSGPAPIAILTNGEKIKDGNEIEPAAYSPDGRFLVVDGDTRVNGSTAGIFPGYLRIYETAEIREQAHMPDPVFVQRALATEFIDFSPDMSKLASGHGDGSVRLWNVEIAGTRTLQAEAFNEMASDRWKLYGSRSGKEWGSSGKVKHVTPFRGHRGLRYLAAGNLGGETHALEIRSPWNMADSKERGIQFAAVATPGTFEKGDFLQLLADTPGDKRFETVIAEFLPDEDGDLALGGQGGRKLNSVFLDDDGKTKFYTFEDFFIDLEPLLPANFTGQIRFRIEANTDADDEEIAFDSLRVTGK